jgi:hypothetical protein
MKTFHANRPPAPHVTALFSDGTHSFVLSEGATLAELATRVDDLGASHEGAPIAIHVEFDSPR